MRRSRRSTFMPSTASACGVRRSQAAGLRRLIDCTVKPCRHSFSSSDRTGSFASRRGSSASILASIGASFSSAFSVSLICWPKIETVGSCRQSYRSWIRAVSLPSRVSSGTISAVIRALASAPLPMLRPPMSRASSVAATGIARCNLSSRLERRIGPRVTSPTMRHFTSGVSFSLAPNMRTRPAFRHTLPGLSTCQSCCGTASFTAASSSASGTRTGKAMLDGGGGGKGLGAARGGALAMAAVWVSRSNCQLSPPTAARARVPPSSQ